MAMDKMQKELAKVIENYFGADAAYLDIDVFTLAKRIMEAGWTKPVRCKDCRSCYYNSINEMGQCRKSGEVVRKDHFCSYGERREGE